MKSEEIIKLRRQGLTIREIQKELNISSQSLVHYHLKRKDFSVTKQSMVFQALGEVSAIFMSQDIKGTEMIMPSRELEKIGNRLLKILK